MAELDTVLADLAAESAELDAFVCDLPRADWRRATPAAGWTIAHQIAHLAWTDDVALLATSDAKAFDGVIDEGLADADYVDRMAAEGARRDPDTIVASWRSGRSRLVDALREVAPDARLPWFGPPMRATSMATARLMETWAHGQDITDALGVTRSPTQRLRHVAHIGVRTRDFAFALHRRPAPTEPFRVELTGPDGDLWAWGPPDATAQVAGPALDFCLLVTQRRHRADLGVVAIGAAADEWLDIAQAFAGEPGRGRPPGQFGGAG